MIVYIGECDQIRMRNGDLIEIRPPVPLGICPVRGLVTAPTRRALALGQVIEPPAGADFEPIKSVDYKRRRGDVALWFHDVENTSVAFTTFGPVFRHSGPPAFVCPSPPGDYICGG